MEKFIILIAALIIIYYLSRPNKTYRKSKKFGEGLLHDTKGNKLDPYDINANF
jgi:hypothetical protein